MKVATLCRLIRENDPRLMITSIEDYNAQKIDRVLREFASTRRGSNVRIQMLVLRHCQLSVSSLMTLLKHLCQRQDHITMWRSPLNMITLCLHEVGYNIPANDLVVALFHGMTTDDPPGLGDVESLDLCMDRMNEASLNALELMLQKPAPNLRNLDMANGGWVDDHAMAKICHGICASPSSELMMLNLAGNQIGNIGAQHLARVLQSPTTSLSILQLASNQIGNDGAIALADALAHHNRQLIDLDLEKNQIGDSGVVALALALTINTHLNGLSVMRNPGITGVGEQVLVESVARMTTLHKLAFGPIQWTANLARLASSMEGNAQIKTIEYVFREETFSNREDNLQPFPRHLKPSVLSLRHFRTFIRKEYDTIQVPDMKIQMVAKYIPYIVFLCEMNRKPFRPFAFQSSNVPRGLWPLVMQKANREPAQIYGMLRQRPDLLVHTSGGGGNAGVAAVGSRMAGMHMD